MKSIIILSLILPIVASAQSPNPLLTALPMLRIPASSRGLAMGDCGIAASTENQSLWYNPAKIAFLQNFHQSSINYTPYLNGINPDYKFDNLNYATPISNSSAFGISLSYLNLGNQEAKDENGATIGIYKSSEFNVAAHYALQVGASASVGMGLRFLGSQPGPFTSLLSNTNTPRSIYSMSADISYYQSADLNQSGRKLEWGIAISNFGPKVGLTDGQNKTFLPTNLGIGIAYSTHDRNTRDGFTFALDLNKLLVPTPNLELAQQPNITPLKALIRSFSDAPGGAPEELQEVSVCSGLEFAFADQFFLRGGVSLEAQTKGNRKFAAVGAGYKTMIHDQSYGMDLHYLIPFGTISGVSPFQNSWGFSIKLNIGNFQ